MQVCCNVRVVLVLSSDEASPAVTLTACQTHYPINKHTHTHTQISPPLGGTPTRQNKQSLHSTAFILTVFICVYLFGFKSADQRKVTPFSQATTGRAAVTFNSSLSLRCDLMSVSHQLECRASNILR